MLAIMNFFKLHFSSASTYIYRYVSFLIKRILIMGSDSYCIQNVHILVGFVFLLIIQSCTFDGCVRKVKYTFNPEIVMELTRNDDIYALCEDDEAPRLYSITVDYRPKQNPKLYTARSVVITKANKEVKTFEARIPELGPNTLNRGWIAWGPWVIDDGESKIIGSHDMGVILGLIETSHLGMKLPISISFDREQNFRDSFYKENSNTFPYFIYFSKYNKIYVYSITNRKEKRNPSIETNEQRDFL